MAKVKIQGHASGTGVLTVTAPNTSTDRTITLPDSTGTLATTADVPSSITDNGDATAITIDSSERVGIGTGSPTARLHVYNANDHVRLSAQCAQNTGQHWQFQSRNNGEFWIRNETTGSNKFVMNTAGVVSIPNGVELGSGTDATAANTLDDYEEGEVTNALDINGTTQTSYASGRGNLQYTKVGRNVHVQAYIDTQGATLATTGALHIRLPFAVSAGSGTAFVTGVNFMYWSVNNVSTPCYTYLNEGDSTISGTNLISEGDGNAITGGSGISVSGTGHRVIMQYAFTYQTD